MEMSNQRQCFEIQETILEQLKQSKVNGFPFFAYTGINDYVMGGDTELKLDFPKNPNKLTHVWINYNYGTDAYDLTFCRNNINLDIAAKHTEIYFDQLAEVIVFEMGVN